MYTLCATSHQYFKCPNWTIEHLTTCLLSLWYKGTTLPGLRYSIVSKDRTDSNRQPLSQQFKNYKLSHSTCSRQQSISLVIVDHGKQVSDRIVAYLIKLFQSDKAPAIRGGPFDICGGGGLRRIWK